MSNRVRIVCGDIFNTPSDMLVLPADRNGTITGWVRGKASHFAIPMPHPFRELGDTQIVEVTGAGAPWRWAVWGASVDRWASSEEAIRRIGLQVGDYAHRKEVSVVSAPLLGSGAGGLSSEASARALVEGFLATKPSAGTTLHIHAVEQDVAQRLNQEFAPMQSVFISYGNPDHAFAAKLNAALQKRKVKTWFFPEDAVPGEKLHRTMSDGVNAHDRVVMICSKTSLERAGVLAELEEALAREAELPGGEVIIPVMIDDHVLTDWAPTKKDMLRRIRQRVIADFRGTDADDALFERQVERVVKALRLHAP